MATSLLRSHMLASRHCFSSRQHRRRTVVAVAADRQADPSLAEHAQNLLKGCVIGVAAASLAVGAPVVAPPPLAPQAEARLIDRDPIKNASALLRYALPIDNKPIRQVQADLDGISDALRIPGNRVFGSVNSSVRKAIGILNKDEAAIVAAFAPDKKEQGTAALAGLRKTLVEFQDVLAKEDKNLIPPKQQEALEYVNTIENAMVKGFPFEVPKQYAELPQLKGRATVEVQLKFTSPREENATGGTMKIVVDGYNAPISAGDFVDLVARGFYDGMEIQRADGFVVQTGKPKDGNGFVDPKTGELRTIPFEVMVQGDKAPVYEITLEELGRYNENPVLPFNAFGTMAMARSEFETNDASSQFFWLLKESELTPTGSNLLDGRYAVFGYVVEGAELLKEVQVGDKIVKAEVVDGLQYLQEPK
ncbi:hypothetical protein N2152v2_003328 [Parachlorella kessleri]